MIGIGTQAEDQLPKKNHPAKALMVLPTALAILRRQAEIKSA